MDVGAWLRGLGLGQYEATFRESEIDAEVLPDLTDGDLSQLGVPLGHRKRLLKAIAALGTTETAAKPPRPTPGSSRATAERRPITVMFCDLVGSTSMAAKLDAEDWRDLVGAYLDEASAAVTGLGGHVLKKLGDGLMALFGYPQAQENDAERAVRAALAIQRALVEINARNASKGAPELSARIGLDSGQVVVDATGEVFGDAPNIAARVQGAAEPASILITATVQRQTAGLFVAEDRGQHELKGVSAPMTLYRIVRASGGGRRGGARVLTPLVGREEELDLLTRRWERARKGEGQLVLIVGEPGLGKSRLMEEFHASLGETPHTWTEWSSSSLLQNTPLHPVAEWGRQRFGADLPAEQRLADLESSLGLVGLDPTEYAPLLAPMLDVPSPEDRAAKLAPEELRRRQLAAMTAWILVGARTQAIVLAFEDLHWADPTSLDLMRALAERGAQAPLLIVATTRPEFRPPWSVRSHHSVISLSPLDRVQVAKMVAELSAHHALPRDIVEGVSERTGGVPLFVEEVTRLLLERGEQGGSQAIPPTLQQSLAARLDRLGSARETAQIGAVLGRGFSYALLQSVAGLDEGALQFALERLAQADILFIEGDGPQANYRFKHALIQDAAYESLLKSRRQALHARAAEILRESASPEPEAIAHHFTQAGLDDLAIEWWGKAGDRALRRSAFQEAIAHLGKAIAMADKGGAVVRRATGGSPAPSRGLTQLHVAYGNALIAARGHGAPETTEAFARARESASGDKDAPERLASDYGLWVGSLVRGELSVMREHSAAFLSDVEARPDSPEAGVAHRISGTARWFAGEYREARDHLECALALFQPGRDDDLAFRFGQDAGVAAMHYLALALWPLGDVERATSLVGRAGERIAGFAHITTQAYGKWSAAMFELIRGDLARAAPNAVALARLVREHDLPMWRGYAVFLDGLVKAESGAPVEGLEEMRRGAELLRKQNVLFDGLIKIGLAEAEARAGDVDRAVATLDEALATSERIGHRAFDSELHRARGEILLKRDPTNPAPGEEALRAAIAVARQQGTRSFELRSALSLAKHYQSTARLTEARAVLAPALEGFSSTPEMAEIAEAQALLAALAETDEVKVEAAHRQRLTQLHVSYGNALLQARGYGAPETTEAFAKARESASVDKDAPGRLSADYGLWVGSLVRGELPSMRTHAAAFLRDVGARPDSPEAGVAHRAAGNTCWFAGEYAQARDHLERALALFQPGRDDDLAFRFGHDAGVGAMLYLAITLWPLGDVTRSIALVESARERLESITHVGTRAQGKCHVALFELMRGDHVRATPNAFELVRLAREYNLPLWRASGVFLQGWVTAAAGAAGGGLEDMRGGAELLREQNLLWFDGLFKIGLAEAEAGSGDVDRALAILDEALATSERIGHRAFDSELHRARGEILLKRDPANRAPAEEALLTAIAVAKQQGTRSFELRAALSLAKLYQSTARLTEAHAVLAPALEGFSSTPEMPEIAEAQALLTALAATDEVKVEVAHRQRLTQLHVAYGNALLQARGYGAPETTEAFAKARESASVDKDAPGRLSADYGLWTSSYTRGELSSMRAHAAAFLNDAEASPDSPGAGVAHRAAGVTCWFAGEYAQARDHLERALALFQPGRDDDLVFRFGHDAGVGAMLYLAITLWPLGDVTRSIALVESARERLESITHVGTRAQGKCHVALFELMRGDHARARPNAFELVRLAREYNLPFWRASGVFLEGWVTAATGVVGGGLEEMRGGAELLREQNLLWFDGLLKIAVAEAETRAGNSDRAIAILDEALATCDRAGYRAFEAELHRARGEMLLGRDPANPAPAEEALLTAIAVAKQQGTRSFELRAAIALAKLYQSTGRPADAHAVLAPTLEGFSPTPEMPEVAEAQTLFTALAATDGVKVAAAHRQRLTQLHVSYGNALIAARGYGAPEATKAFAKAREAASGDKDAPGRLAADYGLWAGSYMRGELPEMQTHAMAFLNDLGTTPDSPVASVARRLAGVTCWCAGEYREARDCFEKALALFQPGRDDDMAFRFGQDPGVAAMANLAIASWPLGEVDRAMSLIDAMETRMSGVPHIGTLSFGRMHAALFELMRGDHARGAPHAIELARLARQHELPMWGAFGVFLQGWATSAVGAIGVGLDDMRQAVDSLRAQNVVLFDGLVKIALAGAEAAAGGLDRALAVLDEGLATADQLGHRTFEADLHRARGDILLARNPANPAPAEEALLTAVAVAKQQGTRSFELRAAIALAKLYQSTGRPTRAHAVLAPAFEGFAATTEMPEIAEAQALLTALAATDEVKVESAHRQRLTQLHVSYGNALIAARGYGAPETTEAFTRARESAAGDKDAPGRLATDYGLWVGSYVRGDLPSMRAHAAAFLRDVEAKPDSPEASIAQRAAGNTCWFAGEYAQARDHFERALALFQPGRDEDLAFRFGWDPGVAAMANLATPLWALGEVDRATSLIDRMQTRIADLTHVGTLAPGRTHASMFALMRRDYVRAAQNGVELARLVREHDLPMFRAFGVFLEGLATAASGEIGRGLSDMRRGVELLREQNVLWFDGLLKIVLAGAEAQAGDPGRAVAILDDELAMCDRTGYRTFEAEMHRVRGETLLERDPANSAPAEEALLTAIAVANQQGTRSFELRAALALAKLYRATGREAEAHAVLTPALEGFAPTTEMPEIAEAQEMIAAIEAGPRGEERRRYGFANIAATSSPSRTPA